MLSSSASIFILATMIISMSYARTVPRNPCKPQIFEIGKCDLSVSVYLQCKSTILRFPGTNFTNSCNSTQIFWNYPIHNFTLIIDTPYTAAHQPYAIQLDAQQLQPQILHIYQVQKNGVVTELQLQSDIITVKSDQNFYVALKLQGPSKLTYYGVNIQYNVVRI